MNYYKPQQRDEKFLTRYAHAYKLLADVPDTSFSIHSWATERETNACGTVACVAGHCALHSWFRRRGLKLGNVIGAGSSFGRPINLSEFFGYGHDHEGDMPPPFNPRHYPAHPFVKPDVAMYELRMFMVAVWGEKAVESAIERADLRFDPDFVRRHVPWTRRRAQR